MYEPFAPAAGGAAPAKEASRSGQANDRADWPNWRGPGSRGISPLALGADWTPERLELVWEAPLAAGWSSPVVADGLAVVTDRDGGQERVLAFEAASGKKRWERSNPVDFDPHAVGRRHGNGPKSTPIFTGGAVISLGIAGWLQSLDAQDGAVRWSIFFPERFGAHERLPAGKSFVNGVENVVVPVGGGQGAPVPLFGYTGSPLPVGKLLVCPVGGEHGGTLMAFDAETGDLVWKSLEENVSYSSPIAAMIAGVEQVVAMTGPRVVGLDVRDGKLLWSHPFQIQYDESISTPVVDGDTVMVGGDGRPLTALRIARQGEKFTVSVAWKNFTLSSYLSSMLVVDGHVYGMNDGGEFACVRVADGQELWVGGNHGYYCTPIAAGDVLLALNEKGELLALRLSPLRYEELGARPLVTSETWTSPAIAGSRLYVRSKRGLACFEVDP